MPENVPTNTGGSLIPANSQFDPILPPTPPNAQVIYVPAVGGRQTVLWIIAVLLAVIATVLIERSDFASFSGNAMAQQTSAQAGLPPVGARGIYAFTGQLGAKEYGLFMMDVDSGTLWCYQMDRNREGDFQLKLVAARSWIFDRFLEEFNVAKPTPNEVQLMVRTQRGRTPAAGNEPAVWNGNQPVEPAATQPPASPFTPALPKEDNPK